MPESTPLLEPNELNQKSPRVGVVGKPASRAPIHTFQDDVASILGREAPRPSEAAAHTAPLEHPSIKVENVVRTPREFKNEVSTPIIDPTGALHNPRHVDDSPIRTFKSDIAEAVKTNKLSMVQIALAENERRRENIIADETEHQKKHSFLTFSLALLLVFLGAGIVGIAIRVSKQAPTTERIYERSRMATEGREEIFLSEFTEEKIVRDLRPLYAKQFPEGSIQKIDLVTGIEINKRVPTTEELLVAFDAEVSPPLLRAFSPTFFFGIHAIGRNHPFLVIPIESYENGFAGMLRWEGDIMEAFGEFFGIEPARFNFTAVPELGTPAGAYIFEDGIVRNRDIRFVKDRNGSIVFLYSFVDKKTLVLTTNTATLGEVELRLRNAKLAR